MRVLAALALLLMLSIDNAAASSFVEGRHYEALSRAARTSDPKRIEVVSVFSYGSGSSFQFDPVFRRWSAGLPRDVNVVHLPAVSNASTQVHARMFYAAGALNLAETFHKTIYDAIHLKHTNLTKFEDFAPLFASAGVSRERLGAAYNSFAVTGNVKKAETLRRGYQSTGVPELVVNGAYRIRYQGDFEQMVQVADFLVKKIRTERGR